jgi:hypothetical protein
MRNELFGAEAEEPGRWRPTVASYRPNRPRRINTPCPLQGQPFLPGLEAEGGTAPAAPNPVRAPRAASANRPQTPAGTRACQCPHCGATEFDEDGDCAVCLEPGVIAVED